MENLGRRWVGTRRGREPGGRGRRRCTRTTAGTIAATLTAFGGGILFSAIALELVPEADREAGTALTALGLLAGTLVYVGADWWLGRDSDMMAVRRSGHAAAAGQEVRMPASQAEAARGESIAVGIFVDGVPESMPSG